jgi:chemotaxis protein MotB
MSKPSDSIVIVRGRHKKHAAHHGGAWKVAFADFVTAMMAFFLVMWLVNQSPAVKSSVAGYFKDPGVFEHERSMAMLAGGEGVLDSAGAPGEVMDMAAVQAVLEAAADRIRRQLADLPGFRDLADQIMVQTTAEGLRIELQDGPHDTFFDSGSARVKPRIEQVLGVVAGELAGVSFPVIVEGHTDSRPYDRGGTYTNWELSTDRANAARRVMETAGLPASQVHNVRGYASTQLRTPDDPLNPNNRRVSIVVPYPVIPEPPAGTRLPGGQESEVSR